MEILGTHAWERSSIHPFDPIVVQASRRQRGSCSWVDIFGDTATAPDRSAPSSADVLSGVRPPDFQALRFRDPDLFVAGSLHDRTEEWDEILAECPSMGRQIGRWLREGLDVFEFFQPFQCKYRGRKLQFCNSTSYVFCKCTHL